MQPRQGREEQGAQEWAEREREWRRERVEAMAQRGKKESWRKTQEIEDRKGMGGG